jgi:hypothetical protein
MRTNPDTKTSKERRNIPDSNIISHAKLITPKFSGEAPPARMESPAKARRYQEAMQVIRCQRLRKERKKRVLSVSNGGWKQQDAAVAYPLNEGIGFSIDYQ